LQNYLGRVQACRWGKCAGARRRHGHGCLSSYLVYANILARRKIALPGRAPHRPPLLGRCPQNLLAPSPKARQAEEKDGGCARYP
jgi:hypothetical protein